MTSRNSVSKIISSRNWILYANNQNTKAAKLRKFPSPFPHTNHSHQSIHLNNYMPTKYLLNRPRDGAPKTRLLIADLAISSAIAFATSSDSMTTTSTCTYIQNSEVYTFVTLDFLNIKLQQIRKLYLLLSTHFLVWKKQLTCLPLNFLSICSYYVFSYL